MPTKEKPVAEKEHIAELVVAPEPAPLATPARRELSVAEKASEGLKSLEDEMLKASLEVVGGAIDFIEIDPQEPDKMPPGWVKKYGRKGAERRHRAAVAGLENAKEAPIGIKVATQFAVGAIKARATAQGGNSQLNINVISIGVRPEKYEEVEVDD